MIDASSLLEIFNNLYKGFTNEAINGKWVIILPQNITGLTLKKN